VLTFHGELPSILERGIEVGEELVDYLGLYQPLPRQQTLVASGAVSPGSRPGKGAI